MTLSWTDWLNVAILMLGLVALGVYTHTRLGVRTRIRKRLQTVVQGPTADISSRDATTLREHSVQLLSALGRRLPIFNGSQRREMRGKLVSAGYRQAGALPVLMGIAIATGLILSLLTVFLLWPKLEAGGTMLKMASAILGLYLGLLLPRIALDKLVRRRQLAIANSFPDALDLMVVCANSGLGLNAIIQRVAHELEFLAPELSDEFTLTAAQLQMSGDASAVLYEMAERIALDSVRSLASTLSQSRQYGTSISEALRILSTSERTARRMRTEEAAAKLSTKMTLPMMLFILPTVLLIVAGPAVLGLINSFGSLSK
ncbi:type II secretion system F family protein [Candidimonas sp. SYP-B2681]|uniref:type II secretion system F family protein n=1 Tax=Candidimonas sp. SYP-B2681 TaxID=2497686 RepID=UPI000F86A5A2|nr:type II secretion system F family protein [Candidimonas sp. SYP-B2681]RTZ45351.1 type II secretion system F family protein [Candidimonas sp. SYP-B2681]